MVDVVISLEADYIDMLDEHIARLLAAEQKAAEEDDPEPVAQTREAVLAQECHQYLRRIDRRAAGGVFAQHTKAERAAGLAAAKALKERE